MSAVAVRMVRASQAGQIRNASAVAAAVAELGRRLKAGTMSGDEFVAATVGFSQLGHTQATVSMAEFITAWRETQARAGRRWHPPVVDAFDAALPAARAIGTLQELGVLDVASPEGSMVFDKIVGRMAGSIQRDILMSGRHTMELTTMVQGTRYRRVTDGNPCSFCAMLAARSDYRTAESAGSVVGHTHRTVAGLVYSGRRRGRRAVGEKYHAHCGCTVVEVLDEPVEMPGDDEFGDLYQRAADAAGDGSTKTILAKMRELGDGVVNDAARGE